MQLKNAVKTSNAYLKYKWMDGQMDKHSMQTLKSLCLVLVRYWFKNYFRTQQCHEKDELKLKLIDDERVIITTP